MKLKLPNHGVFLAQELTNSSCPKDLRLICKDGEEVLTHKVLFAPLLVSQMLFKAIKQNTEDIIQIMLPDIQVATLKSFVRLLYTGQVDNVTGEDLKSLSDIVLLHQFKPSWEKVHKDGSPGSLQVQVNERKKVKRPIVCEETDNPGFIRRSKREKFTAKKLLDFETPMSKQQPGDNSEAKSLSLANGCLHIVDFIWENALPAPNVISKAVQVQH